MAFALIRHFFELDATDEFQRPAIVGTYAFTRRLRAWQALCVLQRFIYPLEQAGDDAPFAQLLDIICTSLWRALKALALPAIRHFFEAFAVAMCRRFPQRLVPLLFAELGSSDAQMSQVLGSLLTVTALVAVPDEVPDDDAAGGSASPPGVVSAACDATTLGELLTAVLPLCCASHGAVRCVAQIIAHRALRVVLAAPGVGSAAYLGGLLHFLENDRDSCKVRRRQARHLELLHVESLCNVRGALSCGPTADGAAGADPIPRTVIEGVQATLTELYLELEAEEVAAGRAHLIGISLRAMSRQAPDDERYDVAARDLSVLQRKPEPWDTLALALAEGTRWQGTNAVGRARQRLIICASLVDKARAPRPLSRAPKIARASHRGAPLCASRCRTSPVSCARPRSSPPIVSSSTTFASCRITRSKPSRPRPRRTCRSRPCQRTNCARGCARARARAGESSRSSNAPILCRSTRCALAPDGSARSP